MSEQLNESSSLPLYVCVRGLQGKCWHLGLKLKPPYLCLPYRNSSIQCIGHWMTLPCHLLSPCAVCLCSECVFECHIVSFHSVCVYLLFLHAEGMCLCVYACPVASVWGHCMVPWLISHMIGQALSCRRLCFASGSLDSWNSSELPRKHLRVMTHGCCKTILFFVMECSGFNTS